MARLCPNCKEFEIPNLRFAIGLNSSCNNCVSIVGVQIQYTILWFTLAAWVSLYAPYYLLQFTNQLFIAVFIPISVLMFLAFLYIQLVPKQSENNYR